MKRIAPLLLAAPLALGACGDSKIDSGKLEREIKQKYGERVEDATVRSVDCPDDIKAKAGTKSECTARLDRGVEIVFAIDVRDDEGNVRWRSVRGTAPGPLLERAAAERLEAVAGQRPAGVECPARITLEAGTTVRCTVRADDGSTIGSTLTIKSPDGSFEIEVDEQ